MNWKTPKSEKMLKGARLGEARPGMAWPGAARPGEARQGKARQGKARQGKARQGKARQGKARQGKASNLDCENQGRRGNLPALARSAPQRDHFRWLVGDEHSPAIHELAALLEGIAPPVCALNLIAHRMRQRCLGDLARHTSVTSPVSEA
jgi:hypothetical protein